MWKYILHTKCLSASTFDLLRIIMMDLQILIYVLYLFLQTELRTCQACGDAIADKYFLEVGGCSWHGSCLRCCVCSISLDRQPSCFQRERQVYCKADYAK